MMGAVVAAMLLLTVLAAPRAAEAQQRAKPRTIGYLQATSGPGPREEAFRQGLRKLGYEEGKSIVIEWRFAGGKEERLSTLAAELVRLQVEVIVVNGGAGTHAAKRATKTIPIVMVDHADPVGTGDVASLARPGGNITGLANIITALTGKRLEILKEAIPGVSRVGVIWNPESRLSAAAFRETQSAAKALGIELLSLEARGPRDFEGAFRAAAKGATGAITVLSDVVMFAHGTRILELAAKNEIPTMHTHGLWVEAGGLLSYGANFLDLNRRAATYVDKILKGARPEDLPVELPTKFELVLNLKTAKVLGLTIPQPLLLRADRVIDR